MESQLTVFSETRIKILKALKERRKTVTELSRELKLSKSTVHEHLEKLLEANLVRKSTRPNRKFVYYELTEQGNKLFQHDTKRIVIIVSSAIISLVIGGYELYQELRPRPAMRALTEVAKVKAAGLNYLKLVIGIALIVIGLALVVYLLKIVRKNRTKSEIF